MTVGTILEAFSEVDPKKQQRQKEEYVRQGLGAVGAVDPKAKKKAKLDEGLEVEVEAFMQNLGRGVIKTSSSRDQRVADMEI